MGELIRCRVRAEAGISPSESPAGVLRALRAILPDCEAQVREGRALALSDNAESLDAIRKSMAARLSLGSLDRTLRNNTAGSTTWFFLNRQAAFAGVAAICEEAAESPLGPITITLTSPRIRDVIGWLAGSK